MRTTVGVMLSVAVAGLLAWSVRRLDVSREPRPTACSRVLDDVFANDASATADSVLLARLMEHEDQCIGDAQFVDQVRRLMLNTQQIPKARALLEEADRSGAFSPDELKAQIAWVDLDEAHVTWSNGMDRQAKALHAGAVAVANDLRARWPEWPLPYLLLDEAGTHTWADSPTSAPTRYSSSGAT